MTTPTDIRLKLRAGGFDCIPVEGKKPPMEKWQEKFNTTDDEIRLWPKTWHFAHNTGCLAKRTPGADLDITDEDAAEAMAHLAREQFAERGTITERIGQWPKRLIPLRTDEPFAKLTRTFRAPDGSEHKIEVLGDGQHWVAFGQHPTAKVPYRWTHGEPGKDFVREDLPYVRREDMEQFLDAAETLLIEQHGFTLVTPLSNDGGARQPGSEPLAPSSRVAAAVAVIPNADLQWDDWNRVGMAIWAATNGSGEGFAVFDAWSHRSSKYNPRATAKKWSALTKCPPDRIGFGTLKHLADQVDAIWEDAPRVEPPEPEPYDPGPQPHGQQAKPTAPRSPGSLDEWDAGDEPGPIPPREWLLGNQFCRGFISSIVAAGGVGKSVLRLLQFISMALGRPLSGQHVFRRSRVLLISLEDDRDELQRRIKAVLDYYGIDRSELKGWLFCASPKLVKLAMLNGKTRVTGPLEQQIRDAIERRKPDLISLDPFIKTHALEENDSGDMDFVCDLLARLAIEYNVAVDSPHHVHKGTVTPGDADSGRGSSGIRDAGRLVYTLANMSEEEASAFGITLAERGAYVRLDPAKVNIAARATNADWFKIIGEAIGNATPEYPNGDTIQVAEPWAPPETWSGLDNAMLNQVLTEIDRGLEDGNFYTDTNAKTDRAAWRVVQGLAPHKNESQCREVIKAWVRTGLLQPFDYTNPKTRRVVKGLKVINSKRPSSEL